jgi:hypothetical protein
MSAVLPKLIDLQGLKVEKLTGAGPGTATSIANGAAGNITITITSPGWVIDVAGIPSITGIPAGLVLAGFTYSVSPNSITITVTLYNPTAAAISVGANAVSVIVFAVIR